MKTLSTPIFKKSISYLLIILTLLHSAGCSYFRLNNIPDDNVASIHRIDLSNKVFFVHSDNLIYRFRYVEVDSLNISGTLTLETNGYYYKEGRSYRIKQNEHQILHEVHMYLKNDGLKTGSAKIPLTNIKEIRIVERDSGKTVASHLFGTLGIIAGVCVIIGVIVALTKSSCPYIYAFDGESYVFEGEIFGGSIAKNLVRDDYIPLPSLKIKDNNYLIRISNELKERQYTDIAQLVVVNHTCNQKVLLDKVAQPQLVGAAVNAKIATSYSGENLIPALQKRDHDIFFFNDQDYSKNGIILKFERPENARNGKLILNAKNTLWFDYLFGKFLSKFGAAYEGWMDKQGKIPTAERLQRMLDNDFPLSIFINKDGKWLMVDYLFTVGPLASRDFVIPINLCDISGKEVEIKVETGFMFWELDYAGMDFSENVKFQVDILKPSLAIGSNFVDWTSALENTDDYFMTQESIGDVTEIIFKASPQRKDQVQTIFLHTCGYYELIRDFKGLPEISELNKFKEPGYFSEFSRDEYMKVLFNEEEIASLQATR
jgi:hypothetical protein